MWRRSIGSSHWTRHGTVAKRLDRLSATFGRLADFPGQGRTAGLRQKGVRVFADGNYLIFYRPLVDGDSIELIRVVHGARGLGGTVPG
ncbi:MAG: hypothetical protein CMH94_08145 [Oceanicaulis sp.]|nr:hypothetical protein [Maricaulis sp.]MBI75557.1 hypothetical protein [Oceanicaulis sp.]